jgi:hypothetical protein
MLKRVSFMSLALASLPLATARAGIEFVTSAASCASKVITAGQTLTVLAGPNVQFEVWGNSVDLADPAHGGFSFTGPGGFSASVVRRHSGPENLTRGCGDAGSAVVRVDSPITLASNSNATISFKMPLGDLSTLTIGLKALPAISTLWTTNGALDPGQLPCIVKTGSIATSNQDLKLTIQLPPGASQDQTTCTSNFLNVRVRPASTVSVNFPFPVPTMKYTVSGLPAFLTENQAVAQPPTGTALLAFTFDVARVRALTAQSTSTITITNPTDANRTNTLTLVVIPTAGQGFASQASPNPASTTAGNPIDFRVTLSAPAAAQQVVTWRMTTAACFTQANTDAPYNAASPFQFFTFPTGQTSAIIRVRSVNNSGCTNKTSAVIHIFEAWVGDSRANPQVTAVTSGPTYTRTAIKLNAP